MDPEKTPIPPRSHEPQTPPTPPRPEVPGINTPVVQPNTNQPSVTPPVAPTFATNTSGATQKDNHTPLQRFFKPFLSILSFILVVVVTAMILNAFVFQSYFVQGTSMTPTLHNNDRLIISKVEKTAAAFQGKAYIPSRGQIVVIDSTVSEFTKSQNEQIIKRVVGLPGDTVTISDGIVTIKNKQEPNGFNANKRLDLKLSPTASESENTPVTVTDGNVFVLGDNRVQGGSFDSRYFGTVSSDKIIGRLWLRIFPFNDATGF